MGDTSAAKPPVETVKRLSQIPAMKIKAGPRDGDLWLQRLEEEYLSLIKVCICKDNFCILGLEVMIDGFFSVPPELLISDLQTRSMRQMVRCFSLSSFKKRMIRIGSRLSQMRRELGGLELVGTFISTSSTNLTFNSIFLLRILQLPLRSRYLSWMERLRRCIEEERFV